MGRKRQNDDGEAPKKKTHNPKPVYKKPVEEEDESDDEEVDETEVREELGDVDDDEVVEEDDDDDFEEGDDDEDDDDAEPKGRSNDDEDEDDDEYEEGEEAGSKLNAVGSAKFASALKKLLGGDEAEEINAEPAKLFQRKTKIMKLEEVEKVEKLKNKKALDEKNKFDNKSVVKLPEKDPSRINRERDLKRIATRGVVALFNAIGAHQRSSNSTSSNSIKDESKESFLKLLQQKATGKSAAEIDRAKDEDDDGENEEDVEPVSRSSGWKVLQEDYLENADEIESESEDDKQMEDDDESESD
jgi:hypothetical protein